MLKKLVVLFLIALVQADIYLHSPRGTNDRCDERSNDRSNDNRLFDSQNNDAGGYAYCPESMKYYEDTDLIIEWTAQHGCGNGADNKLDPSNPENTRCNVVIQLGCEDALSFGEQSYVLTNGKSLSAQGDTCTQTRPLDSDCVNDPSRNNPLCDSANLDTDSGRSYFNANCRCHPRKLQTYGLHESYSYYLKCSIRNRNTNLFTATQNLNGNSARFTRQNNNGNRHGFECPEERDYYPYWHPTGWRDIAVLTSEYNRCAYYQQQSENVVGRGECYNINDPSDTTFWKINNQKDCMSTPFANWVVSNPLNMPAPDCVRAEWQRDNHLGMTSNKGDVRNTPGSFASYKWRIPTSNLIPTGKNELKCVLRLRYNISSAETPFEFSKANNGALKQNPVARVGDLQTVDPSQALPLRSAINTAQYPRTFEDRSEPFVIMRRPDELKGKTIHNVNVRGKRGNIAQVRNCVEYDYVPNVLSAKVGDIIHFQWCGSDHNDPNNSKIHSVLLIQMEMVEPVQIEQMSFLLLLQHLIPQLVLPTIQSFLNKI
jgi:hypothetical protein